MPYCSIEDAWGKDFAKTIQKKTSLFDQNNKYTEHAQLENPSIDSVDFSRTMEKLPGMEGPSSRYAPLPMSLRSDDFKTNPHQERQERQLIQGDYRKQSRHGYSRIPTVRGGKYPNRIPRFFENNDTDVVDENFLRQMNNLETETDTEEVEESNYYRNQNRNQNRNVELEISDKSINTNQNNMPAQKYITYLENRIANLEKEFAKVKNGMGDNMYDMFIYICMGVLIILILDTFVKLGNMGNKN